MSTTTRPLLIALAGNPNVGKSTVFNALTGLRQHTGNWTGKTVALLEGTVPYAGDEIRLVDLPGTYSLRAASREEEIARDFILSEKPDVTVCVVDATCLERNLSFVLQVLRLTKKCVVCLNLMDEARARRLQIDVDLLSRELGVPVVPTAARRGEGLAQLLDTVYRTAMAFRESGEPQPTSGPHVRLENMRDDEVSALYREAEKIAERVVGRAPETGKALTDWLDDIVTSRRFGIPIMLLLLGVALLITISLANYPSAALAWVFSQVETALSALAWSTGLPEWLHGILVHGCFRTVAWVVAVMLPPMAIFFPLFTLLEDFGYLPRVAFNLDHLFRRNGGHGKQALTMSMGFGCNAAGVVAARIIESPRERLIAILTNCFVPCNGRFPTLILLSGIFFRGEGPLGAALPGLAVFLIVLAGIGITFLVSRVLASTVLRGVPSSFVLELPPYRKPELWKTIARSWRDRTVWVLRRAVTVALPCGAITWLAANVTVSGKTVIAHTASILDPLASLLGMDGVILTAFILGFPANEIVLPIALMAYLAQGTMMDIEAAGTAIAAILRSNGWTWTTGLSVLLFSLLHFPCGTTVYTVYQETGSKKWAALSFLIPTGVACLMLIALNGIFRVLGIR
ncbi:MAG TPA: ferrous iron transport protein B [Firmicutes bacterium]|nr:ferrous iron transport protein B [Candidatus Fermentithermobacillaceae bacterium]